eukprot:4966817-Pleurochrysis_carterae.AAC.1
MSAFALYSALRELWACVQFVPRARSRVRASLSKVRTSLFSMPRLSALRNSLLYVSCVPFAPIAPSVSLRRLRCCSSWFRRWLE